MLKKQEQEPTTIMREKRSNTFKLLIDRNNRNTFLRKFKVEVDVVKNGDEVIKITGDTTGAPYNFEFLAPNLFKKMGSSIDRATVTVKSSITTKMFCFDCFLV